MADTNGKKRKRDGERSGKSKKTVAINTSAPTATVSRIVQPDDYPPVIATTAGIEMPKGLVFQPYSNPNESRAKKSKSTRQRELLLHSDGHPSLDYTALEDAPPGSSPALNHFFGLYDPQTGRLEVVQAKKMTVRGLVRAKQISDASLGNGAGKGTIMERRTDLGQTFGTKKAKKAIQDKAINAISPQKKASDDTPTKMDTASQAMLESVGQITSNMSTREQLQAVVDGAKPAPPANLDAEDIQDVYDPDVIIGTEVLKLVPVREWQEKAHHKESIQVLSRFVANRVNSVATNENGVKRLRVLRYMYFVLLFYLHTKAGRQKGGRSIPQKDKLREILSPAPEAVIENIRRRFSEGGEMRKFHIDLLMTECCAFACIVDNFEVDTQNLRDDLRIDQKTMNQYFHEIGGRVKPVKVDGRSVHLAKLTLPLDFPKQRMIKARR